MTTTRSTRRIGTAAALLIAASLAASLGSSTGADAAGYALFVPVTNQEYAPVAVLEGTPGRFLNLDAQAHQIMSVETDERGEPLFQSEVLGVGQLGVVEGVDNLPARAEAYGFYCPYHEWMTGSLTVAQSLPML